MIWMILYPGAYPGADPGADPGAGPGAGPGADPGWRSGQLHKICESNFMHHVFHNFENSIRDMRPFCHPMFCHSVALKYTSSLVR